MKTIGLLAFLFCVLAGAAVGTWLLWDRLPPVEISLHGYLALGLGVVCSLALGIGLMRLVYISHRRGYDETDDTIG